jgi:hypothetical protein
MRLAEKLDWKRLIFMDPVFTLFSPPSKKGYNPSGSKYLSSISSCRACIECARSRAARISIGLSTYRINGLSTYRLCSEMVRIGGGASWQRPTRGVQGCCSGHLQSDSGHWTPDRLEPDHPSRGTVRAVLYGAEILWAVWELPSQRDPPHRHTACNNTVE